MTEEKETTLSMRRRVFIDEYLKCFNAQESAIRAGYSPKTAGQQGWLLIHNPVILEEIQKRLDDIHMSSNEALTLLAKHARGDIGKFVDDDGNLDLATARKNGLMPLVKRIRKKKAKYSHKGGINETETQDIELYSAQDALDKILRAHGKYNDGNSKSVVSGQTFSIPADKIAPLFVDVYRDITQKLHSEYIFKGGRGSTKSSFIAEAFIYLIVNNPQVHGLALRQVADTLRDSVYAELQRAINRLELTDKFHCTTSPMEIEYLPTGQKIYFRGADDPGKIKSITPTFGYIGIVWFEELDQFRGLNSIRTVEQSIRGGDNIVYFKSFNPPPTKNNWANKYLDTPKANQYQHYSNYFGIPEEYLLNEELRKLVPFELMVASYSKLAVPKEWLGNTWLEDAEHLRKTNPNAFENEYLGIPVNDGSLVFTNVTIRKITEEEISQFDNIRHGLDWGFYPDPASYGKFHYDGARRKLYIIGELRRWKRSNEDLHKDLIDSKLYTDSELLVADSAEPKSVQDFRAYGANCKGAEKGPGTRDYSYKWLQGLNEIIIDNELAPYHAEEFQNCEYERTKDGEIITEYPEKNDHAIDDTRYGTNSIWRKRGE